MRISIVAASMMLAVSNAFAQTEQTLMGPQTSSGGFGGPVFRWTRIDGHTGYMSGGRGGWIINHTWVIGGGGYGYVTSERSTTSLGYGQLSFGYGGFEVEYINSSSKVLHFIVTAHIGGGGASFQPGVANSGEERDDALFVMEPGAGVEVNIVKWMRLDLGGSYRFVTGNSMPGLSNADLAGPTLTLTMKFGKF